MEERREGCREGPHAVDPDAADERRDRHPVAQVNPNVGPATPDDQVARLPAAAAGEAERPEPCVERKRAHLVAGSDDSGDAGHPERIHHETRTVEHAGAISAVHPWPAELRLRDRDDFLRPGRRRASGRCRPDRRERRGHGGEGSWCHGPGHCWGSRRGRWGDLRDEVGGRRSGRRGGGDGRDVRPGADEEGGDRDRREIRPEACVSEQWCSLLPGHRAWGAMAMGVPPGGRRNDPTALGRRFGSQGGHNAGARGGRQADLSRRRQFFG